MSKSVHKLLAILDADRQRRKGIDSLIVMASEGRGSLLFDKTEALQGLARLADAAIDALIEADRERAVSILAEHITAAAVTDSLLGHRPEYTLSEVRENADGKGVVVKVEPRMWCGRVFR